MEEGCSNELGLILVTSPILAHPSTQLLQTVVDSFHQVDGLLGCRLLIVADGVKEGRFQPKKGKMPGEAITAYRSYLDRVEELCRGSEEEGSKRSEAELLGKEEGSKRSEDQLLGKEERSMWSKARLLRLPEHRGFGHAVLGGLQELDSEYVMVVQHDHPFTAKFSIRPVLDFLGEGEANYVSLPISTVFRHLNRCQSLHQMDLRARAVHRYVFILHFILLLPLPLLFILLFMLLLIFILLLPFTITGAGPVSPPSSSGTTGLTWREEKPTFASSFR
mgnify:CR=1 FL=1